MPEPRETPDPARSDPARSDPEAALIAGAASGDLGGPGGEQQRAYDELAGADPSVAAETDELRGVVHRVRALGRWEEPEVTAALGARVLATPQQDPGSTAAAARARRRRRAGTAVAAVALLALGGVGGAVLGERFGADGESPGGAEPPVGPPGTLGAVEPIEFRGEPADVEIDAELIAHTWGTETVLDMAGWTPGEPYRLVLVGTDGDLSESGTFRGSEVTIECRMNGDLLREDVDLVEIRDADGRVVARSDVPAVPTSSG